ncbi:MAG TPA: ABC transporter permease [Burkholderiaceae bacterium]
MKLRNVLAMARKEWRHLLRDPRSLAQMFLLPAMMLFIYGYALRLDIFEAPVGQLQESRDAASDELAERIGASRAFRIERRYRDRAQLQDSIAAHEVWAAFVIPHDYPVRLAQGGAAVQLILDGMDANTARLVRNYALALVNNYAATLGPAPQGAVAVEFRTWFNETNESRYAIVPGVIVMVMAVVGALMTALTIAREIESGNLVMLRTTPLTRAEFLAGKLIPYFFIGLADVAGCVLAAVYLFDVPLRGSVSELAAVSMLFLLVVMTQGALISLIAGNQIVAAQMVQVSTFLPAFLLSGVIYAIANMPLAIQYATLLVPARYYVAVIKALFLKGAPITLMWIDVAALLAVLLVLAGLLSRRADVLGLGAARPRPRGGRR